MSHPPASAPELSPNETRQKAWTWTAVAKALRGAQPARSGVGAACTQGGEAGEACGHHGHPMSPKRGDRPGATQSLVTSPAWE